MTKSSKKSGLMEVTVTLSGSSRKGMSYRKLSQDQKRAIIASRKRHGDGSAIAAKTGKTPTYVSNVITGRVHNPRIVNLMYNRVRGRKAKATA